MRSFRCRCASGGIGVAHDRATRLPLLMARMTAAEKAGDVVGVLLPDAVALADGDDEAEDDVDADGSADGEIRRRRSG